MNSFVSNSSTGILRPLFNLMLIPVAIAVLLVGIKIIKSITWGN